MNISADDKLIINKAWDFVKNNKTKLISEKRLIDLRNRAAIAVDSINQNNKQIAISEVHSIFSVLSIYANEASKNVLISDRASIEKAYELAQRFYGLLDESGIFDDSLHM